jgi:ABC-type nitrate/sulfonate/bicarbonate transport system permease component
MLDLGMKATPYTATTPGTMMMPRARWAATNARLKIAFHSGPSRACARETLRAFGFGRLGVITLVDLPSASPFIATGIRLASSIAIILNISTGYLTGRISGNGIGAFIAEANTGAGNTSLVLAAALWAGLLGLAANAVLVWGERRALRWHHSYSLEPA